MKLKKGLKVIFKILLMLWIFVAGVSFGNSYPYQDTADSIFRLLTALMVVAIGIGLSIKD